MELGEDWSWYFADWVDPPKPKLLKNTILHSAKNFFFFAPLMADGGWRCNRKDIALSVSGLEPQSALALLLHAIYPHQRFSQILETEIGMRQ